MAEGLEPQTRIARKEGLVVETLSGKTVMLDPEEDRYLRLNETGGSPWRRSPSRSAHCAGRAPRLANGYPTERAATDTTTFIRGLLDAGAARIDADTP